MYDIKRVKVGLMQLENYRLVFQSAYMKTGLNFQKLAVQNAAARFAGHFDTNTQT